MSPTRIRALLAAAVWTIGAAASAADELPEWLAGCWQGEAGTAAAQGYEAWTAPRAGRMLGISQTLRGTGSIFEYMRIDIGPSGLRYVPQPGGKPPTEFQAARAEAQRVVFANPDHDFPKYVDYQRSGDRLEVRLSAVAPEQDGKRALFAFRRVACDTVFAPR